MLIDDLLQEEEKEEEEEGSWLFVQTVFIHNVYIDV